MRTILILGWVMLLLWFLLPVLPSDTAAGEFPSIRFNARKETFTGHTGCNTMEGKFAYTDSKLQFGEPLRLSKKACTGYNEAAFLQNLLRTNRYSFRDSMLIFWFDQTELMRWTRKPERAPVIKRA